MSREQNVSNELFDKLAKSSRFIYDDCINFGEVLCFVGEGELRGNFYPQEKMLEIIDSDDEREGECFKPERTMMKGKTCIFKFYRSEPVGSVTIIITYDGRNVHSTIMYSGMKRPELGINAGLDMQMVPV